MGIYITQGRFTAEAMKGMVAKPEDREVAVRKLIESNGAKLLAYYMTLGEYDFVIIAEGEGEEENVLAGLIVAAAGGGVTDLKTVQAFTTATAKKAFERAGKIAAGFRPAGT
jgi:uncharacterized protein with GYD domain